MKSKKKNTDELIYRTEIDKHRNQTMVTKEDGEIWINWEYRINIDIPPYTK